MPGVMVSMSACLAKRLPIILEHELKSPLGLEFSGCWYVAFSEVCHWGFSLGTPVFFSPQLVNGFSQRNKAKINVI